MSVNIFKDIIIKHIENTPTNSQLKAIEEIYNFLKNKDKLGIFVLYGYAGTGKTTLISAIIEALSYYKTRTVLLTPTGRAAKVLTEYSARTAFTIHRYIYRRKNNSDPEAKFTLNYNKLKDTLFIVDEASMVNNFETSDNIFGSGNLLQDLLDYVYNNDNNCKLMLVGDKAQLPPINSVISPALDIEYLESLGFNVFSTELTEVVRQAEDSGILYNATKIRNKINDVDLNIQNIIDLGFRDINYINGSDLLEEIESCYSKFGQEETKIVCRSNHAAVKFNNGIRNRILYLEDILSPGDLIMAVRNSYYWLPENMEPEFIANGDIFEVLKVYNKNFIYGYNFADVKIRFVDYPDIEVEAKVLLDTLDSEQPSWGNDFYKKLFQTMMEDFQDIKDLKKRRLRILEDPYFNAIQIKYAYAFTCHKSQGGQWKAIFIDHGYITDFSEDNPANYEFLRWLYTAFTRATEKLYLINFNKKLLAE
jgi:exodeoxyribonuclease-5